MSQDVAVAVDGLSKRFRVYSDRRRSLKEAVVRGGRNKFDEFWALRDVSLEIPSGSTFAFVGHNGSGKSTLLKMIAGVHRPTSGRVRTSGRVSALLELGAGFHPELSGRDNIHLNGAMLGLSRRAIDRAMDGIVDFSGLGEFIDTPVKVYSSGMYVRLGFSIAVNLDPEILVMDEIIAVGDEEFQRRCFDHLYELRRKGVTIVLVSHSLPLVQSLCDRAAWLDHGVVQMIGESGPVVDGYLGRVNEAEGSRLEDERPESDGAHPARRGSGEVQVLGVQLLRDDVAASAVQVGDDVTLRLHYDVLERVPEVVLGLAFHTENGVNIAGPNTKHAGLVLRSPALGRASVDYRLPRCPFGPGVLRVSAAAVDATMLHVFDYRDRFFPLHVQPGPGHPPPGLVDLPGEWRVQNNANLELHP